MLYMVTFTINIPQMLAYKTHTWILWDIYIYIYLDIQIFHVSSPPSPFRFLSSRWPAALRRRQPALEQGPTPGDRGTGDVTTGGKDHRWLMISWGF